VSRDPGHSRQHGHDWSYNEKTGKLSVNKELVLRSKIRIEARQFQMSRLHPQQMGRKTTNRHQKRLGAFDRGGAPAQGRRTHRDDTGVARTAATTTAVGLPPMKKHLTTNHRLPEGSDRDLPVCGEHRRSPKLCAAGYRKFPASAASSLDRAAIHSIAPRQSRC
jgi:hypothetical protein